MQTLGKPGLPIAQEVLDLPQTSRNVFHIYRTFGPAHLKSLQICTGPYVHKYEKTWQICHGYSQG